jgi:hypothetical protein
MSAPGGSEIDDSAGDFGQEEGGLTEAPPGRQSQWKLHPESLSGIVVQQRLAGPARSGGGGRGAERFYLTVEPSYGTSVWIRNASGGRWYIMSSSRMTSAVWMFMRQPVVPERGNPEASSTL